MRKAILLLLASLLPVISSGAQSNFDPEKNTWTISNGWVSAGFQLTGSGAFVAQSLRDLQTGDIWEASTDRPSAFIRLQAGNEVYDADRAYTLVDHYTLATTVAGIRQIIVLEDARKTAQFTVQIDLYDGQPVVRYRVRYRNLTGSTAYVGSVNMLPWTFADLHKRYTTLRVNQWSVDSRPEDFEPLQSLLDLGGAPVQITAGARGQQCGWLAVRDGEMRGLLAGWEFDGRAKASVRHDGANGIVDFSAAILDLHHPVAPGAEFIVPAGFLGLFHGDFDEAGYRTQRFVEAVLAKPAPVKSFPYVSWDSWAYEDSLDEQTLRHNAELASAAGVELFVVDLGWARSLGDWYADRAKFPSGLGALSDYVHSLGMKFGLHFAFAEADPNSPVLQANPDWASSESDGYYGAVSLCLSNQPTRDWVIQQGIRMIDDYHVDWILQDGENMVKDCTKTTHTHDSADSNYSNSVDGLNAVVQAIQAARPNVYWENCENGGNMMTFNMVKSYVTSITNDASGSLGSRRAVYGATYPFPPRYAERYMSGDEGLNPYVTHSYRFGGNWALMNRLPELDLDQLGFLTQQIALYKDQRPEITRGKVFHHAAPSAGATDAIQSYDAETDSALAVITRAESAGPQYIFKPKGLDPEQRYAVFFDIDPAVYSMPGAQLMLNGVRVLLPTPYSSDVVHIQRQ
jgi:alpha-galactosidase